MHKFENSLKQCGPVQNGQCKKVVKSKGQPSNGRVGIS